MKERTLSLVLLLAPVGGGKNTGEVKIVERIVRANDSGLLQRKIRCFIGVFERSHAYVENVRVIRFRTSSNTFPFFVMDIYDIIKAEKEISE